MTTETKIVHDSRQNLDWDARETAELTHKQALAHVAELNAQKFGGFDNWRLPTVEELFLLADRTKHSPAIDTEKFPDCKSDWYWTGSDYAASRSDYAWIVYFSYGGSSISYRYDSAFVRACRPSQ